MAVNGLMTSMIVFRILKVTGAMPSTSFEQTLGSNGRNKLRHIMFIIVESVGMRNWLCELQGARTIGY